jgi:hypothetical protein
VCVCGVCVRLDVCVLMCDSVWVHVHDGGW